MRSGLACHIGTRARYLVIASARLIPSGKRNNTISEIMVATSAIVRSSPYHLSVQSEIVLSNVRFGSQADVRTAKRHVRFTPDSDHESDFSQKPMSALPPKADMCGATRDVCYGPEADIVGLIQSPRPRARLAGWER